MGAVLGKKKASKGSSSEAPRGRRWLRLWLPSTKLKTVAQTNAADINLKRIEDNEEVTKMIVLPPNELIAFGSPVLDILMGLLNQKSLKKCRGVCKSWEDAARRALMKQQCGLKLEAFLLNNVRRSAKYRVELFSSWILKCTPNEYSWKDMMCFQPTPSQQKIARTKFLSRWGNVAKSFTLTGLTLDEECLAWIRKLLCEWCPNLAELNLQFEDGCEMKQVTQRKIRKEIEDFRRYLDDRDEVKFEQIWTATENHAFAPYPVLPNLKSLRVGKQSNRMTSFLSINVILSCPNLRHLFVSEQRVLGSEDITLHRAVDDRKAGFRMLYFLSKRPDITTKLETFGWQDDWEPADCRYSSWESSYLYNREVELQMNDCISAALPRPFLQFGDRLKSLHWNVLHSRDGVSVLFPGVLEQVAGSLRKLDLRVLRTRPGGVSPQSAMGCCVGLAYRLTKLSFPSMPKLSTLQIGFRDFCKLSLNELVDAAPILSTLEISACRSCANGWEEMPGVPECFWEARPSEEPHYNLKWLKSGLTLWNTQILQRAVNKFPNLEELWIGAQSDSSNKHVRERELKLTSIIHTLEQLKSLKRFDWTSCGPLNIQECLAGIAEAGERMRSMESCHIRVSYLDCRWISMEALLIANITRSRFLDKILVTKRSACKFIVTASDKNIFVETKVDYVHRTTYPDELLPYIKRHGLPIQFRCSSSNIC
jgi:hypothetical protein